MESDCRIPVACCRPRVLVLHALFWGLVSLRVFGAPQWSSEEKTSVVKQLVAPCWLLEEFVVTTECSQCNAFQSRSWSSCGLTGYVEKVNCTRSNKDEYKSCRSSVMEEHLFWKFEAAMLALTAVFAVVVVIRQRWLDRLASEKVRRQIESI
ncbi:protein JTB [Sebastes umbrosus]|uniref:protein JTB n=1 Tax=Sebastes umbrosus TaxID=72105 RepID=UPI00189E4817|nr:protein JTB [Sebastes umbrosus]XP_037651787.1 protein JTB [Sebastes umbrosus]XP_037651788.1 protein JTB [Sebastes umbrosus]